MNLAARIEQLDKRHGSRVLASAAVVAAVPDLADAEPLPPAPIRGHDEPIQRYRLA